MPYTVSNQQQLMRKKNIHSTAHFACRCFFFCIIIQSPAHVGDFNNSTSIRKMKIEGNLLIFQYTENIVHSLLDNAYDKFNEIHEHTLAMNINLIAYALD